MCYWLLALPNKISHLPSDPTMKALTDHRCVVAAGLGMMAVRGVLPSDQLIAMENKLHHFFCLG
jgi:hypothetical protein